MMPPLWLNQPDAVACIESANVGELEKSVARSLIDTGIAVVRGAHDPALCRAVIADYERYVAEKREYVLANLDSLGREKRLVNFHLWSEAAVRIGTSVKVMSVLDFIFGAEASVYTSLTFKYGTQQPVHRDTPHFATWPRGYFVGVWSALEPVCPEAGPLFYHPGAHRFPIDEHRFWHEARSRIPDASRAEQLLMALDLYNGEVIRTAPAISAPVSLELNVGDTVIWHPELPHGGLPASNPYATRQSIVFHCAPVSVQVHQHDAFFSHDPATAPPLRYGFREMHGRKVAVAGNVVYM